MGRSGNQLARGLDPPASPLAFAVQTETSTVSWVST
jgi:hypothetical protein